MLCTCNLYCTSTIPQSKKINLYHKSSETAVLIERKFYNQDSLRFTEERNLDGIWVSKKGTNIGSPWKSN